LPSSTGSSLKTLQAMSYRKVVLGTRQTFRGLDVDGGVHCLIEDELPRYPSLIRSVVEGDLDPESMQNEARLLSERYDYRVLFERYVNHMRIGKFEEARSRRARLE